MHWIVLLGISLALIVGSVCYTIHKINLEVKED